MCLHRQRLEVRKTCRGQSPRFPVLALPPRLRPRAGEHFVCGQFWSGTKGLHSFPLREKSHSCLPFHYLLYGRWKPPGVSHSLLLEWGRFEIRKRKSGEQSVLSRGNGHAAYSSVVQTGAATVKTTLNRIGSRGVCPPPPYGHAAEHSKTGSSCEACSIM